MRVPGAVNEEPPRDSASGAERIAEAEFRVFARAVHGPLSRYAARFMRHNAAGDDIAQEALTALWRGWSAIDPERRRACAYRIAHSKAVDEIRQQVARGKAVAKLPAPAPAYDHDAAVDLAMVRDAIADLPPEKRAVVLLARDGLDRNEIAEVLGIRPESVSASLSRTRGTLRALIGRRRRETGAESAADAAFEGGAQA
uniref:RNA polymerase sigma factor n=1 Tax=Amycolatopsis sp. CA-096443 TaxID=3239919 RepID=UPI003F494785